MTNDERRVARDVIDRMIDRVQFTGRNSLNLEDLYRIYADYDEEITKNEEGLKIPPMLALQQEVERARDDYEPVLQIVFERLSDILAKINGPLA